MVISVTAFKSRCLGILRQIERRGEAIEITRHGRLVARIVPPPRGPTVRVAPWLRLRGTGRLLGRPGESVLSDRDFDALR